MGATDVRLDALRALAHGVFRVRQFHDRELKRFGRGMTGKRILEIGSGRPVNGVYKYSARKHFHESNEFVASDVVAAYGHHVIDITTDRIDEEFDIVLCVNVLEHIDAFHTAVDNIHKAVKRGGTAIIGVPGYYPLHDEPKDYWRFTEHSLRELTALFSASRIVHSGFRRYPFAYFVVATK